MENLIEAANQAGLNDNNELESAVRIFEESLEERSLSDKELKSVIMTCDKIVRRSEQSVAQNSELSTYHSPE